MMDLEVKIRREGPLIIIDGTQVSVTFRAKNKDKTFDALVEKCLELERGYSESPSSLSDLKRSLDVQLTAIYQEYNNQQRREGKSEQIADKKPALKIVTPAPTLQIWRDTLVQKYQNLKAVTETNFPAIWPSIEFVLASSRILYIKDVTLPFMGIILGKPSSSKTLALECLRGTDHTFYTDGFTPRSFVSHNSGVSEEQLREIDLLPKIKDNIFLTPELATIFTAKDEEITNLFGIITRVLDGHGYESDTGAQGHRGYVGDYMFVWIGAVVEIPRKIHRIFGTLGPKIYFFRLHVNEKSEAEYEKEMKDDNFVQRKSEVKAALLDYLEYFETNPTMEEVATLRKVTWSKNEEAREVTTYIVKLAKLLARLRGSIPTWETHDSGGAQYAYSLPTIEEPSRAMTQLRNLARGHALSQGRTYITLSDMPVLVNVVLSTAPIERVAVFDLLLASQGVLKTSDIKKALNTTNPTAKRAMAELTALSLVDMQDDSESSNKELSITLKEEFRWFLSEEFMALREGLLKEKFPPRSKESCVKEEKNDAGGVENSFSQDQLSAERKIPPTQTENQHLEEMDAGRLSNTGKRTDSDATATLSDEDVLKATYERKEDGRYRCPICQWASSDHRAVMNNCVKRDPELRGHRMAYQLLKGAPRKA